MGKTRQRKDVGRKDETTSQDWVGDDPHALKSGTLEQTTDLPEFSSKQQDEGSVLDTEFSVYWEETHDFWCADPEGVVFPHRFPREMLATSQAWPEGALAASGRQAEGSSRRQRTKSFPQLEDGFRHLQEVPPAVPLTWASAE